MNVNNTLLAGDCKALVADVESTATDLLPYNRISKSIALNLIGEKENQNSRVLLELDIFRYIIIVLLYDDKLISFPKVLCILKSRRIA